MASDVLSEAKGLMVPGILLIIIGIAAMATPAVAGTAVVYVIGALMIIAGIAQFVQGLKADSWTHKLMPVVLGVLYFVAGLGVLGHPLLGLTFLTLLLAIYFVVEGIWKVIAAFKYRAHSGWLMILFSGVISIILGALIWNGWPSTALWAVGVLVGVDMLLTGIALIAVAMTARKIDKAVHSAGPA